MAARWPKPQYMKSQCPPKSQTLAAERTIGLKYGLFYFSQVPCTTRNLGAQVFPVQDMLEKHASAIFGRKFLKVSLTTAVHYSVPEFASHSISSSMQSQGTSRIWPHLAVPLTYRALISFAWKIPGNFSRSCPAGAGTSGALQVPRGRAPG